MNQQVDLLSSFPLIQNVQKYQSRIDPSNELTSIYDLIEQMFNELFTKI